MTSHFSFFVNISLWLKPGGHIFYRTKLTQVYILQVIDQKYTLFQEFILSLELKLESGTC